MVRKLDPVIKEPEEVSYKSISINNWLEDNEEVTETYVYAYTGVGSMYKELNAYSGDTLAIQGSSGVSEDYNIEHKWDYVKYRIREDRNYSDITDETILEDVTGGAPHERVHRDQKGKFRVALNQTDYINFLVVVYFITDEGREEIVVFGVNRGE